MTDPSWLTREYLENMIAHRKHADEVFGAPKPHLITLCQMALYAIEAKERKKGARTAGKTWHGVRPRETLAGMNLPTGNPYPRPQHQRRMDDE